MAGGPQPLGEGGGPNPPYGEDFFNRIVGVHWPRRGGVTGAVFVISQAYGNQVYRVVFKSAADRNPQIAVTGLPESGQMDLSAGFPQTFYYTNGGSSAFIPDDPTRPTGKGQTVFLLCGVRRTGHYITDLAGNQTGAIDSNGLIYASNDGLSWGNVFDNSAITSGLDDIQAIGVAALVYTPGARTFFYNQSHSYLTASTGAGHYDDEVYSSSTGSGWGGGVIAEVGPGYVSRFPSDYCAHHSDCIDANGNPVPDGVMYLSDDGKFSVSPVSPPAVYYPNGGANFFPGSSAVNVIDHAVGIAFAASVPITTVTGVAGTGGILMAGGFMSDSDYEAGGAVAYSRDGGKTWLPLLDTPRGVTAIMGVSR